MAEIARRAGDVRATIDAHFSAHAVSRASPSSTSSREAERRRQAAASSTDEPTTSSQKRRPPRPPLARSVSGEALAAILGTVAGGAITGGFALLQARIDWQRKKGTRWDDVRRQAYASFLHAAQAVAYEGHLAPIAYYGRVNRGESETAHEALSDLKEAESEMWRWYREIEIVGGEAVMQAANEVANQVRDIASVESGIISNPSAETLERNAAVHANVAAAFRAFTARVREEIGVAPATSE